MVKIRAFLATAICMLFDKTMFEPETAGETVAEVTIEKCEGLFGNDTGTETNTEKKIIRKARRDWLQKFSEAYNCKLQIYLNKK